MDSSCHSLKKEMTKQIFHVFSMEVDYLFKALIGLCLTWSLAFASEHNPSFSFSKEEGFQPLNASPDQMKQSIGELDSSTQQQTSTDWPKTEEKPPEDSEEPINNRISEDFAPETKESAEGTGWLDSLSEDVSWFFQEKKTKHKIALAPVYSYNRTQGSRLGLRFLAYSSDKKGYYFALSGSKYLPHPFFRWNIFYIGKRAASFRTESLLVYDNHYENYFGSEGMEAKLSDLITLYAHRLMADYKIFYQALDQDFYLGLGAQFIFRKELPDYQDEETHFEKELFLFFSGFAGYDSRDNWKNPTEGVFHQLSLGCKSILAYPGSYCRGEGDLRFYVSLFKNSEVHHSLKNSVVALRMFAGSSFLSPGTYSTMYSLGGENYFQKINALRGFKHNRFRGDKIYFAKSEFRFPIWKKYLEGALFTELGEVAGYEDSFQGFVMSYGGGGRLGIPPDHDMKLRADFGFGADRQNQRNYNFIVSFFQAF